MASPLEGNQTSITFGASAWSENITSIKWSGMERASLETSHLATSDWKTFIPASLTDPGELEIEFQLDPDNPPPINGDAETVTVTFPKYNSNNSSGAKFAGTAFCTKWDPIGGAENENIQMSTLTLKYSGEITFTDEV